MVDAQANTRSQHRAQAPRRQQANRINDQYDQLQRIHVAATRQVQIEREREQDQRQGGHVEQERPELQPGVFSHRGSQSRHTARAKQKKQTIGELWHQLPAGELVQVV